MPAPPTLNGIAQDRGLYRTVFPERKTIDFSSFFFKYVTGDPIRERRRCVNDDDDDLLSQRSGRCIENANYERRLLRRRQNVHLTDNPATDATADDGWCVYVCVCVYMYAAFSISSRSR